MADITVNQLATQTFYSNPTNLYDDIRETLWFRWKGRGENKDN